MKTLFTVSALLAFASAWSQPITLEQALETARAKRPAVLAAKLNVERARFDAQALGAYPALTLGVGQSSREGLGATDQDLFVSQAIDVFGKASASRRVGHSRVLFAEAEHKQALLLVQSEVLRAFFEASAASRASQVAQELAGVAESVQKATVRRFEEGMVPEVQVTRSTIELDRAKQTASLRDSQLQAAMRRLAGAVGVEPVFDALEPASLPAPEVELSKRPDLLALEAQVREADAERAVAARSVLPELELVGLRSPWREQPTNFGARLQLTWRVLDFGRGRSEQSAAKKRAEASRATLADARKQAESELAAIDIEIAAASAQVSSYEAIRKAAVELVDKSQRGYTEGFGSLLDVLEATRSLREVEQELLEAQLALNLARTAQFEAAGTLIEVKK